MLNLEGVSALDAVVLVAKEWPNMKRVSEDFRDMIDDLNGNYYSVETIGRRLREQAANGLLGSEDVRSKGKKYKTFFYAGGDV